MGRGGPATRILDSNKTEVRQETSRNRTSSPRARNLRPVNLLVFRIFEHFGTVPGTLRAVISPRAGRVAHGEAFRSYRFPAEPADKWGTPRSVRGTAALGPPASCSCMSIRPQTEAVRQLRRSTRRSTAPGRQSDTRPLRSAGLTCDTTTASRGRATLHSPGVAR